MSVNEMRREVPPEVEEAAQDVGCHKGVKYVYLDGEYRANGPATSINIRRKSTRLPPERIESQKISLGHGWVAFRAVGEAAVAAPAPIDLLAGGVIPELPLPRIGKETRRKKIDGSPLVFVVKQQEVFHAPSNPLKAYLLQKLRMDDGTGYENGHDEFRIAYYMIGHKGRARGRWAFGQFAPIMTPEDLAEIIARMRALGWMQGTEADAAPAPPGNP